MKMKEDSRYNLSLTYGLREDQTLKQIDQLGEEKILPQSRNEVLRRGLHASRYLAEVDDNFLLMLLSRLLHSTATNFHPVSIKFAQDLAFTIYAIQIVKHGINKAETFDTIPTTLQTFNHVIKTKGVNLEIESEIKKSIGDLAISVNTIFLKPLLQKDKKSESLYGGFVTSLLTSSLENDILLDNILQKKKVIRGKQSSLEQARKSLRNKKKIRKNAL